MYSTNYQLLNASAQTALKQIENESIQLVISSPPYNIGKSYETKQSLESYLEEQKKVLSELYRVLKPQGSLCWQVGNYVENKEVFPLDIYFYPLLKEIGFKLRNRIIWHFEHGLHATYRFSGRYESLLWFTKSDDYIFNLDSVRVPSKYPGKLHYKGAKKGQPSGNPLGKNPSDFWTFIADEWDCGIIDIPNVKANHPEKTDHPCQFPIELVERCVLAFTNKNDIVLDPYVGSGSSVLGALKNNRIGIGIDYNQDYIELCKNRIQALENGTLKTRPVGKKVYQPTGHEKITQPPLEWI